MRNIIHEPTPLLSKASEKYNSMLKAYIVIVQVLLLFQLHSYIIRSLGVPNIPVKKNEFRNIKI